MNVNFFLNSQFLKTWIMPIEQFSINFRKQSRLPCFCSSLLSDWSRKLTPPFRPIRGRTETNRDLVTRVFPHLISFHVFTLSSQWLLLISCIAPIGLRDNFGLRFTTLNWIRAKSTGKYHTCSMIQVSYLFLVSILRRQFLLDDIVSRYSFDGDDISAWSVTL